MVGLILSLQIPAVQNYVKDQLVVYLEEKIKTDVSLERVYIDFPNSLVMENLHLKGEKLDTLLSVKKLDVGLHIMKLINSTADLTSIEMEGVRAHVVRDQEGRFNFDYILDAFATEDKEESPSKPFIISLDKIHLKDIGVIFTDLQAQNDIRFHFNELNTRVRTFDLENNNYAVNNIDLDGLKLKLQQDLIEEVAEEVEETIDSLNRKKPMSIDLNSVKFTNFDVDYGDDNSRASAKVVFKELSTKINKIDIENNAFDIENLKLAGARIRSDLYLPSSNNSQTPPENAADETQKPMSLLLGKLVLEDVQVEYNNTAAAPARRGTDFNHLKFSNISLNLEDFKMENGTFAGRVNSAEIRENRGLNIQEFRTDFAYREKQAFLRNLYLQTPKTVLRDEIVLNYNSIEQLSENPGAVKISANIRNSKIGFADLLTFAPDLRKTAPFSQYPNAILNLHTRMRGTLNDLHIQTLQFSGLDQMKVNASGKIRNAMNPDHLSYDLNIRELSSASKTIYNLVPKGTVPSNITLPSFFTLSGNAKGTTQQVNTELKLISTLGNATVDAVVDMHRKNQELYDVKANLQNLQIGRIIQNKDLGIVTAQIAAKGRSFDLNQANADIKGIVKEADYNGYRYRNMNLDGSINRGAYRLNLDSRDPNANLKLAAMGIYNENNPSVKINGDIVRLDLNKLGFYQDPMIIAGKLDGDFTNLNPDFLNGVLRLQNFAISDTKDIFPLQEVYLNAVSTDSLNQLTLQSQIADIELSGKYKMTQIFGALQETLNQYYQFQKPGTLQKTDPNQHFTFNARIKNDDLIRRFVPDLKSFETITLNGNFDADSRRLEVNGSIPQLLYGENTVEDASLLITNENRALQVRMDVATLQSESFALNKINISGDVADNTIQYSVTTKDEKDVTQYLIAGTAASVSSATEITLNTDGLKLNYDDWTVAPNNKIVIGEQGIFADNFRISNAGSEILLQSESMAGNSPLNVSLKDFKIETLTEIIKKDSLLAQGTINGTAQLRNLNSNMTFVSDLDITNLLVYGSPVGNLDVKVNNTTANVLNADVTLSGNNNDVKILGDYNTSSGTFDLDMNMHQLQMQTVQGFSMNAVTNTEGYLSGNMKITGTVENPDINGSLKFNNAGLMIAQTGSDFRNINDKIDFTGRGIEFNRFKINDKDGNALVIEGQILTDTYRDFNFNLDVNAQDFKVVNSEKSNDAMMYGILAVDASLQVRGNMDLPRVDGRIAVADNTNFTFVIPQSTPSLQERAGIVEFIDQDQIALQETIKADSLVAETKIQGMDVNVNIEVDKEAKLSIIIDKANGDFVELQGEAQLTGGIDPSGKTTLVGVYVVEEGAYELSVSMLKRRFDIEKGSTITWTGEPTTADLDITAVYKTDAAPIDLLEQQLSGRSAEEMNQYKQRIPFNTLLKLSGELLKPVITFDITTDEDNVSVSTQVLDDTKAKLAQLKNDEAEMNKQVFALLLLNRFIGENPFQSEAGLSAGTMVRQSVSKILSQQLNNLASDLIEGVDLTFDLESSEDYTSGARNTRTDLGVDISKKLLDDRLKVSVGSNFGLEGDARQNENTTNIAGDVTVDYSLSKDGRYMLRAYRKNEYQVALQGQIIETGVGFIITLDYNKFRDIFRKKERNKNRRNHNKDSVEFK
ncbi:translocation/assembly module TamB [Chryseobacterium lacus]|nr:translocation/assembly module TamB [Chryseobacterium lacus]